MADPTDGDGDGGDDDDDDAPARKVRKRTSTASVVAGVGLRVAQAAEAIGDTATAIGEKVGASLSHLPMVPKTRRGRVLARSVLVSFCLVFAWISVIVGLQLRGERPPDLRPQAEAVLVQLRDNQADAVYQHASDRFQEVVLQDTFVIQMEDLSRTLGPFKEITAVVATEINRGPSGVTARVDLRLAFEHGKTKGNISFRREPEVVSVDLEAVGRKQKIGFLQHDVWLLLGLSVEVPEDLIAVVGSKEARLQRVTGDVKVFMPLVEDVLTRLFTGRVYEVWIDSALQFQQTMGVTPLQRTVDGWKQTLGGFKRVVGMPPPRLNPGQSGANVDALIQFENATIKGSFQFTKIDNQWRMWGIKLVLPLPPLPT